MPYLVKYNRWSPFLLVRMDFLLCMLYQNRYVIVHLLIGSHVILNCGNEKSVDLIAPQKKKNPGMIGILPALVVFSSHCQQLLIMKMILL